MSETTTQKRIEAIQIAASDGTPRFVILDHERKEAYNYKEKAPAHEALAVALFMPDILRVYARPIPGLYEALADAVAAAAEAKAAEGEAEAKATDTPATD